MSIARLFRLLLVLRDFDALPRMRFTVGALFAGMSSIGYVGCMLLILFYVFALLGMTIFRDVDPWHFGMFG